MDFEHLRSAVDREATDLVAALRAGDIDAKVPTCPAWTLVDLATHVGQFCAVWTHVLCEAAERPKTPYDDPPIGADADWFAGWVEAQAGYLSEALSSTTADAPAWTWDPSDNTARFIARRSAHELAVHRFDVQTTRGTPHPIEGRLAVDGIEEIFAMIRAWRAQGQDIGAGDGETLHLHTTDPDAEWTVTLTSDGPTVERTHTKGQLALRGAASDLELVLYDRPPIGALEQFGDEVVLAAWKQAFHFD